MSRSCIATLIFTATFLSARPTDASVVTFNYTGQWSFHDPQQDTPDFWAAMASVGVVPGSEVFWSLMIDAAAADQNPSPAIGVYNAVLGSTLRVGSLTLTTGPATMSVDLTSGPGFFWIGNMGSPVQGYAPQYFQLQSFGPWSLPSDALLPALTHIGSGGASGMILGFNNPPRLGSAQYQGLATWTLVSVTVPAPSTLPLVAVGLTVFALYRRRGRPLRR
jgi:hypothetical protein